MFTSVQWTKISDSAQDFLQKALVKDPKHRASAKELLAHPWLWEKFESEAEPLKHVSANLL